MKKIAISVCIGLVITLTPGRYIPPVQAAEAWKAPSGVIFRQDNLTIDTAKEGYQRFTVEIAETPQQSEYGLMNRTTMPADHGMLFISPMDRVWTMWMKNTIMWLDMLFIDGHGKIVYIAQEATPQSEHIITAGRPVRAVLELPGGTCDRRSIKIGDRVISEYFKP